ncbi:hypothetical protein TrLO_g3540 [Triparma laevis f. longispina]|uniref:SWIM-type domain-containing protein n=1 Tax=Triparma laevis f. longispina TaxID=1714387 RepID=A0A9W7EC43_9STRA|nr:hypothetical protein TrLO_g3540 [Triparma laevis f. longispina]
MPRMWKELDECWGCGKDAAVDALLSALRIVGTENPDKQLQVAHSFLMDMEQTSPSTPPTEPSTPSPTKKRPNPSPPRTPIPKPPSSSQFPTYPIALNEISLVQGSGEKPYEVKNCGGGFFSCTCPAWEFQKSRPEVRRTCKHIKCCLGVELDAQRMSANASHQPTLAMSSPSPKKKKQKTTTTTTTTTISSASSSSAKDFDVGEWVVSEKLDGMRCIVVDGKAFSRARNSIHVPTEFWRDLPDTACLDGELWICRGKFQNCVSITKRHAAPISEWNKVTYMILDSPKTACGSKARLAHARIMLCHPTNAFKKGRVSDLLKVKHVEEIDAVVIGYTGGEGQHEGAIGALKVELSSDRSKKFKVCGGFSHAERELSKFEREYIGCTIEVKYNEMTKGGIPRFPIYLRTKPNF